MLGWPTRSRWLAAAILMGALGCSGRRLLIDQTGERIFTWGPVEYAPEPRPQCIPHHQNVGVAVIPADVIAPPGSEVVLLAAVRGTDGFLHANQRVEWMLAPGGVGQFVGLGRSSPLDWLHGFQHWPHKISPTYALGLTSSRYRCLHRGTPDTGDDVRVERGQAWISVSSPVEGTSYVTAYAPGLPRWDTHQRTATIHWIDAEVVYPPAAVNPAGTRHTLTTTVTRHTTRAPLAGWLVRYQLLAGGPPAGFAPEGADVIEVVTDAAGHASAELEPTAASPGTRSIAIQVISPTASLPNGERLVMGNGSTTKTWSSAEIAIHKTGPAQAAVGDTLTYTIEVRNPGGLTSKEVVVADQVPEGTTLLASTPPASVTGERLEWRLGDLPGGQSRAIELKLRADKPGVVQSCATVASGGTSAQDCVATTILSQTLDIALTGPTQAIVGRDVMFEARITNRSGAVLKGLTIVDRYDEGFDHVSRTADGPRMIESDLGDLGPGESGRVDVTFRVTQPGTLCHLMEVHNAGGTLAAARACLAAVAAGVAAPPPPPAAQPPQLSIKKSGPVRVDVGQPATFEIVVTNTGPSTANKLVVVDRYGSSFRPLQATPGFQWDNQNQELTWEVSSLPPRQKPIKLTVVGIFKEPSAKVCNQVTVSCAEGARGQDEACVAIDKPNGLVVLVSESPDPVVVGNQTAYEIRVTNYAQSADQNLAVEITLPDGLTPLQVGTKGPGVQYTMAGQVVTFKPIKEIGPAETLTYTVVARAERAGNFTTQVAVSSRALAQPQVVEETTTVEGE